MPAARHRHVVSRSAQGKSHDACCCPTRDAPNTYVAARLRPVPSTSSHNGACATESLVSVRRPLQQLGDGRIWLASMSRIAFQLRDRIGAVMIV